MGLFRAKYAYTCNKPGVLILAGNDNHKSSMIKPCRWRSPADNGLAVCSSVKLVGADRPFDPEHICGRCPYVDHEPVTLKVTGGPGTELAGLLSWWGIGAEASCACKAHARQMDAAGPDWCESNTETIVGWLKEEADRRGLLFISWLARAMVRKAIKAARRKTTL